MARGEPIPLASDYETVGECCQTMCAGSVYIVVDSRYPSVDSGRHSTAFPGTLPVNKWVSDGLAEQVAAWWQVEPFSTSWRDRRPRLFAGRCVRQRWTPSAA